MKKIEINLNKVINVVVKGFSLAFFLISVLITFEDNPDFSKACYYLGMSILGLFITK